MKITHRFVDANGIRMHLAEAGEGPTVVLTHGYPETWYSWRHQLIALAEAGYHAIAPDQRGYGLTDKPEAIDSYTMPHLVGDLVGLLDATGITTAAIVGHDWGAPVAWNAALLRPDRFTSITALSVPFRPRSPVRPTSAMPRTETEVYYQLFYQEPGVAEATLERDPWDALCRTYFGLSGEAIPEPVELGSVKMTMVPIKEGRLGNFIGPTRPPNWLSDDDLDVYAEAFSKGGFRGPLNWYRNIDRNWDLMRPWAGAKISVPALYIAGDRDVVMAFPGMEKHLPMLNALVPRLTRTVMLDGCGHWTQQERPKEVNAALIEFLRSQRL
jgi:pimeloyl-ACP methyl ester carboxylesterase